MNDNHTMDTTELLDEFIDALSSAAVKGTESFLSKKCAIVRDWTSAKQIVIETDHVISLTGANSHYRMIVRLGVDETTVRSIFNRPIPENELIDVFCDMVELIFQLASGTKKFIERFGEIQSSMPVLTNDGKLTQPFSSGVSGAVVPEHCGAVYFAFLLNKQV